MVGFLVQLIKSTALTSIIGFDELLRTSNAINNATFEPFTVYGLVARDLLLALLPADPLRPRPAGPRGQGALKIVWMVSRCVQDAFQTP